MSALIFKYTHPVYSGNNYAGGYIDKVAFTLDIMEIPDNAKEITAFYVTLATEYSFDKIMELRKKEIDKVERADKIQCIKEEVKELEELLAEKYSKIKELKNG